MDPRASTGPSDDPASDPAAFAALREAVLDDSPLLHRLRQPAESDAFVARVVAAGAARGLRLGADAVRAAMRADGGNEAREDGGVGAGGTARRPAALAERLFGWTPFRLGMNGPDDPDAVPRLDWCHLDADRMVEPFFHETVARAMRHPFNLAFGQTTAIQVLDALPPGLPVAGLIFTMGRSGSTLVAQTLAAFESNIVVAEAQPIGAVLGLAGRFGENQAAAWLGGLVNAFAQQRFSYERRLFVKFRPIDTLDIALVRRAFPGVPWVLVTRDPAAILASLQREGSEDLRRGRLPAARLGLDAAEMWRLGKAEYHAHAIAALARAGCDAFVTGHGSDGQGGRGLILDHSELPEALATTLPAHFGLRLDDGAAAAVRALAKRHAKRPGERYDAEGERAGVIGFRALADAIAGEAMAALRERR